MSLCSGPTKIVDVRTHTDLQRFTSMLLVGNPLYVIQEILCCYWTVCLDTLNLVALFLTKVLS